MIRPNEKACRGGMAILGGPALPDAVALIILPAMLNRPACAATRGELRDNLELELPFERKACAATREKLWRR